MPEQPKDLQAWLEELKRRAEQQQRGGRPQASPSPAARPVQQHAPRPMQQAPRPAQQQQPLTLAESQARVRTQQARLKAEEEKRQRAEAEQRKAELQRRRQAKQQHERQRQEAERLQREAAAQAQAKPQTPRSALGLSGDLAYDLRHNPRALREAIVLLEVLGPPLADRDPMERFF